MILIEYLLTSSLNRNFLDSITKRRDRDSKEIRNQSFRRPDLLLTWFKLFRNYSQVIRSRDEAIVLNIIKVININKWLHAVFIPLEHVIHFVIVTFMVYCFVFMNAFFFNNLFTKIYRTDGEKSCLNAGAKAFTSRSVLVPSGFGRTKLINSLHQSCFCLFGFIDLTRFVF